jgi:hypothetical protein
LDQRLQERLAVSRYQSRLQASLGAFVLEKRSPKDLLQTEKAKSIARD